MQQMMRQPADISQSTPQTTHYQDLTIPGNNLKKTPPDIKKENPEIKTENPEIKLENPFITPETPQVDPECAQIEEELPQCKTEPALLSDTAPNLTVGIGLDSAVIQLRDGVHSLIQTTDFFYPLIDDPYIMGKIACANVLSDMYAMGVPDCDNMLMLVGVPYKMKDNERDVVYGLIMKGFRDKAAAGGTSVSGGDIKVTEWCMIGGTATAVVRSENVTLPYGAVAGDVLVLTKPLGTQNATFAYQWCQQGGPNWDKLGKVVTKEQVIDAYFMAVESMTRLNRTGASLMAKYQAHAATDITGFGLLGHADNLAKHQKAPVSFVIRRLPIFAGMAAVEEAIANRFMLLSGRGIETSGGLLIAMPKEQAPGFCQSMKEIDGWDAWVIGDVTDGDRTAYMDKDPEVIDVWL